MEHYKKVNIFWFRRDLRLNDNVGFCKALQGKYPVLPIFIFDTEILNKVPKDDARVTFIHNNLQSIRQELQKHQSNLAIYHGTPLEVYKKLLSQFEIQNIITNHDYEPYALKRDKTIQEFLALKNIGFYTFKDQVIFEKDEVVKNDGSPYVVYTPYKNKWKSIFNAGKHLTTYDCSPYLKGLLQNKDLPNLSLNDIGFSISNTKVLPYMVTSNLINNYENTRNFPALKSGTSHLGPHLRFGTVSIRQMVKKAIAEENEIFWSELIWREFFMQIFWHFPHTKKKSFRPKYDRIVWRNNEAEFEKWKTGTTGYALVDAGMRELNATGYMHNRVRMLVASFLCKHLLIDWRWGATYFSEKLLDYEQASNIGNWQWAAGSGVDAAPYFRIFNPITQVDKFDKQKLYIKKWVPEIETLKYPPMMIDHKMARERCLKVYKAALL